MGIKINKNERETATKRDAKDLASKLLAESDIGGTTNEHPVYYERVSGKTYACTVFSELRTGDAICTLIYSVDYNIDSAWPEDPRFRIRCHLPIQDDEPSESVESLLRKIEGITRDYNVQMGMLTEEDGIPKGSCTQLDRIKCGRSIALVLKEVGVSDYRDISQIIKQVSELSRPLVGERSY